MKISVAIILLIVLVSAPFPATAQSETVGANALYERAQRAYFDLKADGARQNDPTAWRSVLNAYALVIDSYPNDPLVDDITFIQAGVYREMYQLFGERPLLEGALERYRTVIRDYPDSYLQQAALFAVGDMQETHLKSPEQALETFAELLKRFPRGYKTAVARERLILLQRTLNKPERTASLEPVANRAAAGNPVTQQNTATEQRLPADALKAEVIAGDGGLVTVRPKGHTASKEPVGIVDIRTNFGPSNGRVVIELDREIVFSYRQLPAPNRRIYFDLENVLLARSALKTAEIAVSSPYLRKIRLGQNSGELARAVFDFDAFRDYTIFTLPGPDNHFRIVMDLHGPTRDEVAREKTTTGTSQPSLSDGAKKNQNGSYTLSRQLGAKINRIIIDPGHGGHDPGTSGFKGLTEKSLNLDVAKRLQAQIIKHMPGVEVILTRDKDNFVTLDQRPAFSKAKEGDLFISIHSNYARKGKASGIETYYMNYASDAEAEELAARENALNQMNQAKLAEMVVRIMTNNKKEESKELASFIQNHLYQQTRAVNNITRNRGVKSAPFVVLIGTDVPSVLVEIGFINHPTEGKLLLTDSYRDRIATGLLNGIKAYIESVQ